MKLLQFAILTSLLIIIPFGIALGEGTNIAVFSDAQFKAMPEYNSKDVEKLFRNKGIAITIVDHKQLEELEYPQVKLLIIPYIRGNFSENALKKLIEFHEHGGGLLFLGDLPNIDKWYPYRNMQSSDFYLSRETRETIEIVGLSQRGEEIIGNLHNIEYFSGKRAPSIRVSAYPPDLTYNLVRNKSGSGELSSVVAVERKGERFFGSRLGVIGFNGGEPRENVDGAYQMEWEWNPGMLTRDWSGCDSLVLRMAEWIYNSPSITGAIDLTPVQMPHEENKITIRIRNLSGSTKSIRNLRLTESISQKQLLFADQVEIPLLQSVVAGEINSSTEFGHYKYILSAEIDGEETVLATFNQYVLPDDTHDFPGFGYSTYWAFRESKVSEPYEYFNRQMKKLGFQYLRANVPWEDIEPEPGVYDWGVPKGMLRLGKEIDLPVAFWMFATTRGSGLGDGGVPWWSLKEPAIDRDGNKGFHPTLWSPFYRKHYFGMIDAFTKQFAHDNQLMKFVLDFGNSDFPYGYNYYINPGHLFDYSSYEREAFASYLNNNRGFSLNDVSTLYGKTFSSWADVPVPYIEQPEPWAIYLDFRRWSVHHGLQEVARICAQNAPDKLPKDLPGHGLGSISDLVSSWYDVKSRHWLEERKFDSKYTELHNSGSEWGGEPWQVGGTYKEFDDALFGSLQYNANYFSIPATDLFVDQEGIAKVAFIRRTIMGAKQAPARIAVIDRVEWDAFQSLNHVAVRMDQRADLLGYAHRFDFSIYDLLVLPPDELHASIGTNTTGSSLLPTDEHWYWLLRESVEKGLSIVVFPNTCVVGRTAIQLSFLRQIMGLEDVEYGERANRAVEYPEHFGGGRAEGHAASVLAEGEVLLRDKNNEPILVKRNYGEGAIYLAGWDNNEDSFDGKLNYFQQDRVDDHTLVRLANYMQITPEDIKSNHLNILKSMVVRDNKEYLLLYSHLENAVEGSFTVKLLKPADRAYDLATGETFSLTNNGDGWYTIDLAVYPRTGRYLSFRDIP